MNLLQLAQAVFTELGLNSPNAVMSSTDDQVIQMRALMNRAGAELMSAFDWQRLQKEHSFYTVVTTASTTTVNGSAVVTLASTSGLSTNYAVSGTGIPQDTVIQSVDSATQLTLSALATASGTVTLSYTQTRYSLPSDFDRITNNTQWDKTNRWMVLGPQLAAQWQWLKSGYISSGPRARFRIIGNQFAVWPPPANGLRLGFEYISNQWAASSSGAGLTQFSADTDTCVFSDRLMILLTKLKFFQIKGFDTTPLFTEYMVELDRAKSRDGGAPTLSLAPSMGELLISERNLPDTGYGA